MAKGRTRTLAAAGAAAAVLITGMVTTVATEASPPPIKFAPPVKLAGHCGGEPSIDSDASGHVYVSSPKGILAGVASCEGLLTTSSGIATWYSNDGGRTFSRKITAGTMHGGGDSDTTVDPKTHDVYTVDLEAAAADVCVSHDHGRTWVTAVTGAESCTSPVNLTGQAGPDNDREWIVTYGPTPSYPHHDVYLAYHDFVDGAPLFHVSRDGAPFVPVTPPSISDPNFAAAAANGTVVAKPVIDKAGTIYSLVTTQAAGNGPLDHLWLIKSKDHGLTWTAKSVYNADPAGGTLGLIFNDITMDGGGALYVLTLGNVAGGVPPANAYLFRSMDHGATWSRPIKISKDKNAVVLPALHGGPHLGQLAIGWYDSENRPDPNDEQSVWRYETLISRNATAATPTFKATDVGATENSRGYVHQGGICTLGILCTSSPTDPGAGNRNLADFTSVTIDRNGCAVYTFADDGAIKPDQSNFDFNLINNDVVRQTSGCFT